MEERLSRLEAAVERLTTAAGTNQAVSLPEPLAWALARYGSVFTQSGRFFCLLDAGEIAIKYSCAVAMAFAPEEAVEKLFATPPSLGSFAAALGTFMNGVSLEPGSDPILRTLVRSFRKENGKPTSAARYLLDEFVNIRNRERGHASALMEGAYESLCRRVEPVLLEALKQCDHLHFHFLRIESVNPGKEEWFEYSVTLLSGVAPTASVMPVISRDRIRQGSVCLWDGAQHLVPLVPLVDYRTCSSCGLDHCFFIERVDSQGFHLHSYTANHRMVLKGTLARA